MFKAKIDYKKYYLRDHVSGRLKGKLTKEEPRCDSDWEE